MSGYSYRENISIYEKITPREEPQVGENISQNEIITHSEIESHSEKDLLLISK
jgi:hypothetical protein